MAKKKTTTKKTTTKKSTQASTTAKTTTTNDKKEGIPGIVPGIPRNLPLMYFTNSKKAAEAEKQQVGEVILQFGGKELSQEDLLNRARNAYAEAGNTAAIQSIKAYVKPEQNKVYYVVNDTITGAFDLQL